MAHPKFKISDDSGNTVSVANNRLAVETESEGFTTWVTYPNFQAATTTTALNLGDGADGGLNVSIIDAKEILIQADDENSSYIMIGHSAGTAIADATIANRQGIKLNGGQMLILAISSFASIFIDAQVSGQYVNVAYFK